MYNKSSLKGSFLVLMIDDFHNINVIKTPQGRQLSNAVHMATLLMDIQNHRPVHRPNNIHREVEIHIPGKQPEICKGGICSDAVIKELRSIWAEYCHNTFLENAPANYREIDPRLLQQSLKELRYI